MIGYAQSELCELQLVGKCIDKCCASNTKVPGSNPFKSKTINFVLVSPLLC